MIFIMFFLFLQAPDPTHCSAGKFVKDVLTSVFTSILSPSTFIRRVSGLISGSGTPLRIEPPQSPRHRRSPSLTTSNLELPHPGGSGISLSIAPSKPASHSVPQMPHLEGSSAVSLADCKIIYDEHQDTM